MPLTWNIEKVKDYKELTDEEWRITDTLVWLTMAVGIRELTEANAKEFYARVQLMEHLHGAWLNEGGKPRYIRWEEVQRNIGLTTNASTYTRNQFNKRQLDRFYADRVKEDK